MRAWIYAVRDGGAWRWRITLDPRIDVRYWSAQGKEQLHMLALARPVGKAFQLLHWLQNGGESADRKARGTDPDRVAPKELADRLGMPVPLLPRVHALPLKAIATSDTCDGFFHADRVRAVEERLAGRSLLAEEALAIGQAAGLWESAAQMMSALQAACLAGAVALRGGMEPAEGRRAGRARAKMRLACGRCGGSRLQETLCGICGERCRYCPDCIAMGKVSHCSLIVECGRSGAGESASDPDRTAPLPPIPAVGPEDDLTAWSLSAAQETAVRQALAHMRDGVGRSSFFLWAVTGAGKTEMLFPLLQAVLGSGGRVAIATPRRDVVLELLPRIRRAFPERAVTGLYGGGGDPWGDPRFVVATTHQLLRFRDAFDLLIVDEMDAFPFRGSGMLERAAARAVTAAGRTVWLSATPPPAERRSMLRGRLPHAWVPVRYHGRPLPVPKRLGTGGLSGRGSRGLRRRLAASVERGAQVFVFVPLIREVEPAVRQLRQWFAGNLPPGRIAGVSSADPDREHKVRAFRDGTIRLLVTTTILERGVTVPRTDVYVLQADHPQFDASSLVQMAGRAGRSADDPEGSVFYVSRYMTRAQQSAIRDIRRMNRIAARDGYLRGAPGRTDGKYSGGREEGKR